METIGVIVALCCGVLVWKVAWGFGERSGYQKVKVEVGDSPDSVERSGSQNDGTTGDGRFVIAIVIGALVAFVLALMGLLG